MRTEDVENLAEFMYSTYCKAVGGKAFNGDPLPDWKTFAADPSKAKQVEAWRHTAQATFNRWDPASV